MTTVHEHLKSSREENNERLWQVLEAYKDDPEGVTKEEAIALADFRIEQGRSKREVFDRAMQICKRRAENLGMFIPRATMVKGRGYAYVLAERASTALDGYMAQERVTAGVQRSATKHEQFIERDLASLPPMLRTIYKQSIDASKKVAEVVESLSETEKKNRDELYAAYREEQSTT